MLRLQVQFRLRQLSKADDRTRDLLLKDLERFAFSGNSGAEPLEQGEGGLSYDTAADSEKVVRLGGRERREGVVGLPCRDGSGATCCPGWMREAVGGVTDHK